MALSSTHPFYDNFKVDWEIMRDTYEGERAIKKKTTKYLPATPGQILDGMKEKQTGLENYRAYLARAVFHDLVSDAVESYIGLLHQKPATFELPAAMEALVNNATNNGEGLQALLQRINEQQLVTGRLGLLLDLPSKPSLDNPLPYIALYIGEAVRNWDDSDDFQGRNSLSFAVLDETTFERTASLEWQSVEKYRVLQMVPVDEFIPDPAKTPEENREAMMAMPLVYKTATFRIKDSGDSINSAEMQAPMYRGQMLEEIPFVFVNSKDIISNPDNPPLLGLARLALAIYRGEADYRNALFMQGQDTLVVIGGLIQPAAGDDDAVRVGAGARLEVNQGGDAKYIGVASEGLSEMRTSLENDMKRAEAKAGQLVSPQAGKQESGAALQTRLAAQTATLNQIALSGAAALENLLKIAARWMGQDAEKVKVTPNLEFADFLIEGKAITELMAARSMGAPLSLESIHEIMVERGLTNLSFEAEMDKVAEEDAGRAEKNASLGLDPTGGVIQKNNPDDPNADPAQRGNRAPANA